MASARGVGVGVGTVAASSSSAAAGAGPRVATSGKHSLPTLQRSGPKPRRAGSAWPRVPMADLSTRAPPFFAPPPPQKVICAIRRLARRRRRKFAASRRPANFQEGIRSHGTPTKERCLECEPVEQLPHLHVLDLPVGQFGSKHLGRLIQHGLRTGCRRRTVWWKWAHGAARKTILS